MAEHCGSGSRIFELFAIVLNTDLRMLDLVWLAIRGSMADRWAATRNGYLVQTLMVLIEKSGKVQHLPAVLAREIVRQYLQFVEHDILHVIVVEDWIHHETVCVVLSATYQPISLIE